MPIVQVWVNTTNNNSYVNVPIYGLHNIKVMSLQYHETNNPAHKIIQVISDKLISTNSATRFLTFKLQALLNLNYDSGVGPSFERVDLNGKIFINVVEVTSAGVVSAIGNFTDLILTLQVDPCQ
jgi:hypothetical protein